MNTKKTRRVLAVVALVFMAIFSVTFVITLIDPALLHGAFGYMALISFLLGLGLFLVVRFLLKPPADPAYLPAPDDENDDATTEAADEQSDAKESDASVPTDPPQPNESSEAP